MGVGGGEGGEEQPGRVRAEGGRAGQVGRAGQGRGREGKHTHTCMHTRTMHACMHHARTHAHTTQTPPYPPHTPLHAEPQTPEPHPHPHAHAPVFPPLPLSDCQSCRYPACTAPAPDAPPAPPAAARDPASSTSSPVHTSPFFREGEPVRACSTAACRRSCLWVGGWVGGWAEGGGACSSATAKPEDMHIHSHATLTHMPQHQENDRENPRKHKTQGNIQKTPGEIHQEKSGWLADAPVGRCTGQYPGCLSLQALQGLNHVQGTLVHGAAGNLRYRVQGSGLRAHTCTAQRAT